MNDDNGSETGEELITQHEGYFSLQPKDLDEALKFSEIIADSDFVPNDYKKKPGNVLVAVQMGQEVGLKAMAALQNIAVINGRPTIWGDAALAVVLNHPQCVSIEEQDEEIIGKNQKAVCKVQRRGRPLVVSTFSMEDARKAGLSGKAGPWKSYPNRMMKMRARGFALRDSFPDALKGLSIREEVEDYIDVQPTNIQTVPKENVSENTNPTQEPTEANDAVRVLTPGEVKAFMNECFSLKIPSAEWKKMLNDHDIPSLEKMSADRYVEMFEGLGFLASELNEKN